jgi:hypothetical protein
MKLSSVAAILCAGALVLAVACSKDDKDKKSKPATKAPTKSKVEPGKQAANTAPGDPKAKTKLLALKFHHDS